MFLCCLVWTIRFTILVFMCYLVWTIFVGSPEDLASLPNNLSDMLWNRVIRKLIQCVCWFILLFFFFFFSMLRFIASCWGESCRIIEITIRLYNRIGPFATDPWCNLLTAIFKIFLTLYIKWLLKWGVIMVVFKNIF